MKTQLDRLLKAVNELAATGETPAPDTETDTVDMSMDEFVAYCTDQVEKAGSDPEEVRAERLKALVAQIEIAKNFEGPTPGKMKIAQFKDPAQITPKSATAKTSNAPQTTNFSSGAPTQPAGTPSTPSGGKIPPQTASGSGFESPAAATFAKAVEGLTTAIAKLTGEGEAAEPPAATEEPPAATEEVSKSEGDDTPADGMWPMDMNTPFGRGETEDDVTPEWGFDSASSEAAE